MAKLTLTNITAGYASNTAFNANFTAIIAALENTLSRDGTTPNTMSASLDMNSNRIINLAAPVNSNDGARLLDIQNNLIGGGALLNGNSGETFSGAAATAAAHFVRLDQFSTGWIPDTNTWTYTSASTFTVPTNQTSLYVPGLKIKWTDSGGVKYGVVLSSVFGAVTVVTILVNTVYVIANSAITTPSFSFAANQSGFPDRFAFAVTVEAMIPGGTPPTFANQAGNYYTVGRRIFFNFTTNVVAAGTGTGGINFNNLPITVAGNDGVGIGKENAVNGMMGVLVSGTNIFTLQTYSGGNPIVNSYYWSCQANVFF